MNDNAAFIRFYRRKAKSVIGKYFITRNQLRFKPEYKRFAENILEQLSSSDTSGAEPLFVGLHVRRTDYVQFSKVYLNKNVVGKTYFLEAIEYFQEEYPDNKVYFVAVSDDLPWVGTPHTLQ